MTVLATACPQNALHQFQECTRTVLPEFSLDSLSRGPEAKNQVKDASNSCRDSRLNDATKCIENILDQCKGDSREEVTLRQLVSKENTMNTVEYFCKNLRVYETNAACIFEQHEEVGSCSRNASNKFETKVNQGASFDMLISESCRFYSKARHCLTKTTRIRCGQEAADFVFTLLTGSIPPHCSTGDMDNENPEYTPHDGGRPERENSDDWNSSSNIAPSNPLTLLICTIVIFCYFR